MSDSIKIGELEALEILKDNDHGKTLYETNPSHMVVLAKVLSSYSHHDVAELYQRTAALLIEYAEQKLCYQEQKQEEAALWAQRNMREGYLYPFSAEATQGCTHENMKREKENYLGDRIRMMHVDRVSYICSCGKREERKL